MGQIEYFLEKSENQELIGHFDNSVFVEHYHDGPVFRVGLNGWPYEYIKRVYLNFVPQPDVTAYELAVILNILEEYKNGRFVTEEEYKDLPERIRKFLLLAGEE